MPRQLTLSVVQWDVLWGQPQHNRQRAETLIDRAVQAGAEVVLLPELANSGYPVGHTDNIRPWAEPVTGTTVQFWQHCAARWNIAVVGGLAEIEGETLFNSLVVVEPQGVSACYRKTHLFDREKLYFQAGTELCVTKIRGATVGLMICYDAWFPEVPRSLVLHGAEVLLMAGAVQHDPRWCGDMTPVHLLLQSHAYSQGVFVASALRTGAAHTGSFSGQSSILGPFGVVGPLAPITEDAVVTTTLDLIQARIKRRTKRSHLLLDRRPELYTVLGLCEQTQSALDSDWEDVWDSPRLEKTSESSELTKGTTD